MHEFLHSNCIDGFQEILNFFPFIMVRSGNTSQVVTDAIIYNHMSQSQIIFPLRDVKSSRYTGGKNDWLQVKLTAKYNRANYIL